MVKLNKLLKLSAISLGLTAMFASGVMAAPAIQEITAYLRPDIKIVIDGTTVATNSWDGTSVIPISYNGTTYLPLRAIGNALNKTVTWDNATQTVYLGAATVQDPVVTDADKQITTFEEKTKTIVNEVSKLAPAAKFEDRIRQYLSLASKINTVNREINILHEKLERDFENGKMVYSVYKGYVNRLEALEEKLAAAKEQLAAKTIEDDDIIVVGPKDQNRDKDKKINEKISNIHEKTQSYKNKLEALEKQFYQLKNKNNKDATKQYKDILAKLDQLDKEIEELEACLKYAYRQKAINSDDLQTKINTLNELESTVKNLEISIKSLI